MGWAVYTLSWTETIPKGHKEMKITCMMMWLRPGFLLTLLFLGKFMKALLDHMNLLPLGENNICLNVDVKFRNIFLRILFIESQFQVML